MKVKDSYNVDAIAIAVATAAIKDQDYFKENVENVKKDREILAAQLRARDPKLVIVLVTGWGNEEVLAQVDATDVDLTARKPLTFNQLQELLLEATALYSGRT